MVSTFNTPAKSSSTGIVLGFLAVVAVIGAIWYFTKDKKEEKKPEEQTA